MSEKGKATLRLIDNVVMNESKAIARVSIFTIIIFSIYMISCVFS